MYLISQKSIIVTIIFLLSLLTIVSSNNDDDEPQNQVTTNTNTPKTTPTEVDPTVPAVQVIITEPASPKNNIYKIGFNIKFGWKYSQNFSIPPEQINVFAKTQSQQLYTVAANLTGNTTEVIWDTSKQSSSGSGSLPMSTYRLFIFDERGIDAPPSPGRLQAFSGLNFYLYTPGGRTDLPEYTCAVCQGDATQNGLPFMPLVITSAFSTTTSNNFPNFYNKWDYIIDENHNNNDHNNNVPKTPSSAGSSLLYKLYNNNNIRKTDDDQKRKLEMVEDVAQQLPTKLSHSITHSDLMTQQSQSTQINTATEDSDQQLLRPPKKKPGRKPSTNTAISKRKAQNRAAQRAFRERKDRYVKDLEINCKQKILF
ncbi:4484_t:CDS:2 [Entrophospora sp. SA101]|nr:4484_t:CDS:2 [Entrophospora sp. SA101]